MRRLAEDSAWVAGEPEHGPSLGEPHWKQEGRHAFPSDLKDPLPHVFQGEKFMDSFSADV